MCPACQSPRMQTELSRPAARTRTDHYGPIKSGAYSETERSGHSTRPRSSAGWLSPRHVKTRPRTQERPPRQRTASDAGGLWLNLQPSCSGRKAIAQRQRMGSHDRMRDFATKLKGLVHQILDEGRLRISGFLIRHWACRADMSSAPWRAA